jgi:hypothetical protein
MVVDKAEDKAEVEVEDNIVAGSSVAEGSY